MNQNILKQIFSKSLLQLTLKLKTNLLKKINILNQKFNIIQRILVKQAWFFYTKMFYIIIKNIINIIAFVKNLKNKSGKNINYIIIIIIILILIGNPSPSSSYSIIWNNLKILFTNNSDTLILLNISFLNIKFPDSNKSKGNNKLIKIPLSLQFKLELLNNLRRLSDTNNTQKYCVNTVRDQIEFVNHWKDLINNSNKLNNKIIYSEYPNNSDLEQLEDFLNNPFNYTFEDSVYWLNYLEYWNNIWLKKLDLKEKNKNNKSNKIVKKEEEENKEINELITNRDIRDALDLPIWFSNDHVWEIYNLINEWSKNVRKFTSLVELNIKVSISNLYINLKILLYKLDINKLSYINKLNNYFYRTYIFILILNLIFYLFLSLFMFYCDLSLIDVLKFSEDMKINNYLLSENDDLNNNSITSSNLDNLASTIALKKTLVIWDFDFEWINNKNHLKITLNKEHCFIIANDEEFKVFIENFHPLTQNYVINKLLFSQQANTDEIYRSCNMFSDISKIIKEEISKGEIDLNLDGQKVSLNSNNDFALINSPYEKRYYFQTELLILFIITILIVLKTKLRDLKNKSKNILNIIKIKILKLKFVSFIALISTVILTVLIEPSLLICPVIITVDDSTINLGEGSSFLSGNTSNDGRLIIRCTNSSVTIGNPNNGPVFSSGELTDPLFSPQIMESNSNNIVEETSQNNELITNNSNSNSNTNTNSNSNLNNQDNTTESLTIRQRIHNYLSDIQTRLRNFRNEEISKRNNIIKPHNFKEESFLIIPILFSNLSILNHLKKLIFKSYTNIKNYFKQININLKIFLYKLDINKLYYINRLNYYFFCFIIYLYIILFIFNIFSFTLNILGLTFINIYYNCDMSNENNSNYNNYNNNNNNNYNNLPVIVEDKKFLFVSDFKSKFQNNSYYVLLNNKYMHVLKSQGDVYDFINNFNPNNRQYILDKIFFGDMIDVEKFYGNPYLDPNLNTTAKQLFIEGKLIVENKEEINKIVFINSSDESEEFIVKWSKIFIDLLGKIIKKINYL